MSYRLFYSERSAAMGVRVLLEEMQQQYELIPVDISMEASRPKEMLKFNPNGWVPVLVWQDRSMYECGAITTFLCDRHPEYGLSPAADQNDRGAFLQWLFFFSSSIQNAFQLSYYPFRFSDQPEFEPHAQARGNTRLVETWTVVNDAIGSRDTVLESGFSAVDIYLFMLTTWIRTDRGHPDMAQFENVHRVAGQVAMRPAVRMVYEQYFASNA